MSDSASSNNKVIMWVLGGLGCMVIGTLGVGLLLVFLGGAVSYGTLRQAEAASEREAVAQEEFQVRMEREAAESAQRAAEAREAAERAEAERAEALRREQESATPPANPSDPDDPLVGLEGL